MKLLRTLALPLVVVTFSGCASVPSPKTCAAIGAGLGGAGGAAGGYEHSKNHHDAEAAFIGIGSALAGAALGYVVCAALQDEAPPPAPPPPPPPAPKAPAPPPPPPAPAPPAEPDPCDQLVTLEGVTFDSNQATLKASAVSALEGAATALGKCPAVQVRVEAHTDSSGADDYNMGLSKRRAASVVDFLTNRGISSERLTSEGHGETTPIAPNNTREGRAANRRVELRPLR